MAKIIGVRSPAADRFALVASTMIQAEPAKLKVDLLQGIGLEQEYKPEGCLIYTDTCFKTLDDITVFAKVYGSSSWKRQTHAGICLNLREASWVGNMPHWAPGIVGGILGSLSTLDNYGIQVWGIISLFAKESTELPAVMSPAADPEQKLLFLASTAKWDKGLVGCKLELKYSPRTFPGEVSYLQPDKVDEFVKKRGDAELISASRHTWGIEGELVAIVPTFHCDSHRLVIKGWCEGGPGKDVETFMVVPAHCAISGLIFDS